MNEQTLESIEGITPPIKIADKVEPILVKKNKRGKTYNTTPNIEKLQNLHNINEIAATAQVLTKSPSNSVKKWMIEEGINKEAGQKVHSIMRKSKDKIALDAAKFILKLTGDIQEQTPISAQGNITVNIIDRFELNNNPTN